MEPSGIDNLRPGFAQQKRSGVCSDAGSRVALLLAAAALMSLTRQGVALRIGLGIGLWYFSAALAKRQTTYYVFVKSISAAQSSTGFTTCFRNAANSFRQHRLPAIFSNSLDLAHVDHFPVYVRNPRRHGCC